MSTRISAGVGDHPCFLTFYIYDPYKITNFSLYLFVCFLWDHSWRAPNKLLVENLVSQYASYLLIFSPLRSVIGSEQHQKHLYNQTRYYGKYEMHDRQSACPSYWYKSGCVALTRCIIMLRFASNSLNIWLPFLAKNNARSAFACIALT